MVISLPIILVSPIREEMRKEEKKEEEMIEIESHQESQNGLSNSHLKSFSSSLGEDFNERKQEFLSLLKNCEGYPFNEAADTMLFEIIFVKHLRIDITYQLHRKIDWWTKRASPTAVKSKPRTQLLEHFEKAYTKKVPENAGDMAKKCIISQAMKERAAWLEREIRKSEDIKKKDV